jgi:hypothetical protein
MSVFHLEGRNMVVVVRVELHKKRTDKILIGFLTAPFGIAI